MSIDDQKAIDSVNAWSQKDWSKERTHKKSGDLLPIRNSKYR